MIDLGRRSFYSLIFYLRDDIQECYRTIGKIKNGKIWKSNYIKLKQPKSISIIGGGISGLSAAYYASKAFPATKVHLFEASDRLGGWINSERINLGNYGTALIESGPRTLRPNGVSGALVLDLVSFDRILSYSLIVNR